MIAASELAGHILIYNKDKYDNMNLKRVAKALKNSCDKKFNKVKSKVVEFTAKSVDFKISILRKNVIRNCQYKNYATINCSTFV